jgi:hypothetical protein
MDLLPMKRGTPNLHPEGTVWEITDLVGPHEPDGKPTHICCCDPSRALCGADTTGQSIKAVHPKAGSNPCPRCVELDLRGAKCAEPKCPGPGATDA